MPIYEYRCEKCNVVWEAIRPVRMREEPLDCPCGEKATVITSVTAPPQFNGDGWTPIHHPGPQD